MPVTLPWLCCDECDRCTHRKFDADFVHSWSRSITTCKCGATVADMVVRSGSLYVLGYYYSRTGTWLVQKWSLSGTREWSTRVGVHSGGGFFTQPRVDSDGTTVWVCCGSPDGTGGEDNLFAFDASDGSALWSYRGTDPNFLIGVLVGFADIEPDGSGGVFAAGSVGYCGVNEGSSATSGFVWQFDADGNVIRRFGGRDASFSLGQPTQFAQATALLLMGGKLYVGHEHFETECFCPDSEMAAQGILSRYTSSGTLEYVSAWYDQSLVPFIARYPQRLVASPDETLIFATAAQYASSPCPTILKIDPDTGHVTKSADLATFIGVTGNFKSMYGLGVGADFLVVTGQNDGGYAYKLDYDLALLDVRKNTGTEFLETCERLGDYFAVHVNQDTDDIYLGGEAAGCVLGDDVVSGQTVTACSETTVCACGYVNQYNEAVVDCGCDNGIPCTTTLHQQFTDCLAGWPTEVEMTTTATPGGSVKGEGSFIIGEGSAQYRVTVTTEFYCYTEQYSIFYQIRPTSNGVTCPVADFTPTVVSQLCETDDGHPGFTFSWDGTFHESPTPNLDCLECGDITGSGGLGQAAGVDACGCTGIPTTLTATISGSSFTAFTVPIAWNGTKWVGSGPFGDCGFNLDVELQCFDEMTSTFSVTLIASNACVSATQNEVATCSPFLVSISFGAPGECCGASSISVTITV